MVTAFAVVIMTLVSAFWGAKAVQAHGAITSPASRTYTCFLEDPESPDSTACQTAVALGGTQPLYDWFAVLRSDGAGRTRGFIPDGQLCSGGTSKYAAYDAPRTDWPATTLQSGASFTFVYAAWAPHPGTISYYVTKDSYDATKPLTWDDLEPQPFLTAVQPPVVDGSYRTVGMTPANKHGRHIIYTVWARSDSQETFYGCADVVFGTETPGPTPTPQPIACTSTVHIDNSWPGGYQAAVTIKNTSSLPIIAWSARWTVPTGVTLASGWNATVTQDSTLFIASAPSWNRVLAAGASVSIGFVANGPSTPAPSAVALNGTSCT